MAGGHDVHRPVPRQARRRLAGGRRALGQRHPHQAPGLPRGHEEPQRGHDAAVQARGLRSGRGGRTAHPARRLLALRLPGHKRKSAKVGKGQRADFGAGTHPHQGLDRGRRGTARGRNQRENDSRVDTRRPAIRRSYRNFHSEMKRLPKEFHSLQEAFRHKHFTDLLTE